MLIAGVGAGGGMSGAGLAAAVDAAEAARASVAVAASARRERRFMRFPAPSLVGTERQARPGVCRRSEPRLRGEVAPPADRRVGIPTPRPRPIVPCR